MISELFGAIDDKDPGKFTSFLSQDCTFKFGNLPEISGKEDIQKFVAGFFDSIDSLSHDIVDSWSIPDGLICHGHVSYTRKDGSMLTVPFANIFKLGSTGIYEYQVFADTSLLYL